MKTMNKNNVLEFKSLEEEKAYWESRGICSKESEGEINKPVPFSRRSSFLSVRFTGEELTQFRDFASKFNTGPSSLARLILLSLMQRGKKTKKMLTYDQILQSAMKKATPALIEKTEKLVKDISLSGKIERSILVIDVEQQERIGELGKKFVELMFEAAGVNLITPSDSNYEKVKSVIKTDNQLITTNHK